MNEFNTIILFLIGLFVSTIIIYLVTKLLSEKEGFGKAFVAAIVGTIVYTFTYYLIGNGLISAIVAGLAWLIALRSLYKIGWLKSLVVAILIWICATVVGILLPTVVGPL